jgi:hypothetical protein
VDPFLLFNSDDPDYQEVARIVVEL